MILAQWIRASDLGDQDSRPERSSGYRRLGQVVDVKSLSTPIVLLAYIAISVSSVSAPALTPENNHHQRVGARGIGLNFSGTYSSPKWLFDENYKPWWGLGGGIVVGLAGDDTVGVQTTRISYLNFSSDAVRFEESTAALYDIDGDPSAALYSLHLGVVTDVPVISTNGYSVSIFAGEGVGGTSFSIDDEVFDELGGTTLTEIKHEVNMTNLSTNRQFGIELFAVRGVSLQYSYAFMEVDRTWKVFHSLVSSTANSIVVDGVPWFVRSQLSTEMGNSLGAHVAAFVYKLGASFLWDYYTRDYGNWPYDDEPSMRFRRQALGLTYYFPLPKKEPPKKEM
jgi:hypothetical protein